MQKLAFYSTQLTKLDKRAMKALLQGGNQKVKFVHRRTDAAAQQFIYQWPDGLQVVVNRMPGKMIRPHLAQMYAHLSRNLPAEEAVNLARYLLSTTAVMAMVVKPDVDARAQQVIDGLRDLTSAMVYRDGELEWPLLGE